MTLTLIGPLVMPCRVGTVPAAGAAMHDLNGYSWKFPGLHQHAYACKPMADHSGANLHILALQHVFYPQNECLHISTG